MESGRMSAYKDAVYICQRVSHSISARRLFVCVQKISCFSCLRSFCFMFLFFGLFVCPFCLLKVGWVFVWFGLRVF